MKKTNTFLKKQLLLILIFISSLFQFNSAQALSDELIQREVETKITESKDLRDTQIKVQVKEKLIVLSGEVRLYEQKLVSERVAWKTTDVFEVENEIEVKPKHPVTDKTIKLKIKAIINEHKRFHSSSMIINVDQGRVSIYGSFPEINGPTFLKHKIAKLEGVVDIDIHAKFFAFVHSRKLRINHESQ